MTAINEIAKKRRLDYVGDYGIYNTVGQLMALCESGQLIGGSAEGTWRDWTSEESSAIKRAYRDARYGAQPSDEHADKLAYAFPGEAEEVDRESPDDRADLLGKATD